MPDLSASDWHDRKIVETVERRAPTRQLRLFRSSREITEVVVSPIENAFYASTGSHNESYIAQVFIRQNTPYHTK